MCVKGNLIICMWYLNDETNLICKHLQTLEIAITIGHPMMYAQIKYAYTPNK